MTNFAETEYTARKLGLHINQGKTVQNKINEDN